MLYFKHKTCSFRISKDEYEYLVDCDDSIKKRWIIFFYFEGVLVKFIFFKKVPILQ